MSTPNPHLGVSSWSLHRSLERGDFTLLELPALTAAHGLNQLEICHFHFASTDPAYLAELRQAIEKAGITFYTLLMDAGDITHTDAAKRDSDFAEIARWIGIASECGAQNIRVIAGDTPPSDESLRLSANGFLELAKIGDEKNVKIVVENWHALLDRPADVLKFLELTEGKVSLKLDFGNWKGDRKYADLPQIASFAASTHAKADFPQPGQINLPDFTHCLDICKAANFAGPHILIYDSPGDEWASLDEMREIVLPYLA